MEGWIKLHRSCLDHWLYTEYRPLTRREAWETILFTVNFEPKKVIIKGQLYDCNRGQSLLSLQSWAEKFVWSIQQVRTFFKLLENDNMIIVEGLQYSTRLTVCNYAIYQDLQQAANKPLTDGQQAANKPLTTTKEREERKNNKKEKNNIEYKNILLSKIDIFDFPELKFEYLEIALSFQELFKSNLTEAKASTATVEKAKGSWIDDIRMMVEIDKVKIEDLREIFKFLKKDQFWKQNILSTKKLREKYPQLKMKINGESKQTTEFASKKQSGNRVTDAYKQRIVERILAGKPDEDLQNK